MEGLDPAEQAGQLLMVGLDDGASRTSLDRLVARRHLGGVILLGGWAEGTAGVRATTRHLEGLASPKATSGLGLMIAADQEGGAVQQLKGAGFSTIPSARVQGRGSASDLEADATRWGRQLATAGINVNLAPVADTVPASLGTANGPIGRYGRQFSSDPERVATMVPAFIAGMRAGGVATTVKHFPGIGRIVGNTDVTARGITDSRTTADDPYLAPFAAGIKARVDLVMVGSAIYSKLEPGTNAAFSKAIVTDLLRGRLGYPGVIITDDVGAAKAVAAIPVGARATRFIEAGGDIVLSAPPSTIPTMHDAITSRMAANPAFAAKVKAAATRVVDLKLRMKLATCP
ncbi:beta-N-acetylhexosaminidase [Humibacillus xanthopallidus]|uniref:beta-N-acetylhexosaminidase n=1 Tax=Humibacillus xanthopallidus TaxID=412689 RepID=A0A543PXY1_9MICO|nr:beta-N-acetylhexosaminidase [Humibacillus xanthopallidus]